MSTCPKQDRLAASTEDDELAPDGQAARLPGWLAPERVAEARRVWSNTYGRVISDAEAVEILGNVRRLSEAFLAADDGDRQ